MAQASNQLVLNRFAAAAISCPEQPDPNTPFYYCRNLMPWSAPKRLHFFTPCVVPAAPPTPPMSDFGSESPGRPLFASFLGCICRPTFCSDAPRLARASNQIVINHFTAAVSDAVSRHILIRLSAVSITRTHRTSAHDTSWCPRTITNFFFRRSVHKANSTSPASEDP